MPDKYDEAIAELMAVDERKWEREVLRAWDAPSRDGVGCLFQFAGISGLISGRVCGCLTQIRAEPGFYAAATPDLTDAIAVDERLPSSPRDITPEDLPVFAEWQRKIDAMGVR